jgi:hypothetical protein
VNPKLTETDVFVEDVTTNVVFVNLVTYANHGLSKLAVEARLRGTEPARVVELQEGQHAALDLELPLTSYVQSQVLELRLVITPASAEAAATTPWQGWDLEAQGAVVSVTAEWVHAAARDCPCRMGSRGTANGKRAGSTRAPGKETPMKEDAKGEKPRGLSIHIGLNRVDPTAYDGWDGTLAACVNDAKSMKEIAEKGGYEEAKALFDEEATADAVLEAIGKAAEDLVAGDHLLLTYAGHGGQIPDDTGDEEEEKDETWVLYDRQLLDDELSAMWSKFADGVRIFVVSDSCHSGTVVRMADFQRRVAPRLRAIPPDKALWNYHHEKSRYRNLQWLTRRRRGVDGAGASVVLVSGCQDNQYSQDGTEHGLFTEKLLEVWDAGAYKGDHRGFHQKICDKMPPEQSPNYLATGPKDAEFESMRPFDIGAVVTEKGEEERAIAAPSIRGATTIRADGGPPAFEVEPSPFRYYAVEIASDPAFFVGGGGERAPSKSYGSWSDVHRGERGTEPRFTMPAAAWERMRVNKTLYYRIWATKHAAAADWKPYQLVSGVAPIVVLAAPEIEVPPPVEPAASPTARGARR